MRLRASDDLIANPPPDGGVAEVASSIRFRRFDPAPLWASSRSEMPGRARGRVGWPRRGRRHVDARSGSVGDGRVPAGGWWRRTGKQADVPSRQVTEEGDRTSIETDVPCRTDAVTTSHHWVVTSGRRLPRQPDVHGDQSIAVAVDPMRLLRWWRRWVDTVRPLGWQAKSRLSRLSPAQGHV
jgi:hypothetical protein